MLIVLIINYFTFQVFSAIRLVILVVSSIQNLRADGDRPETSVVVHFLTVHRSAGAGPGL